MKKLLLSITAVCTAIALNAQQNIINGDFEAAMTPIPGTVNTSSTTGWGLLLNGVAETADPFEGSQAAKLATTIDPALNAALSWGSDTLPGVAEQVYTGAFTDVANMTISFQYKTTIVGADKAFIQVAVFDTLNAGAGDDVALYFDNVEISATEANWTEVTFTMNPTGDTGTANRMIFVAASSKGGYFNDPTVPEPGTTLWLDDVKIVGATSGIEENTVSTSVYPNPANDVLNIVSSEEVATVSIISLDGKVALTTAATSVSVETLTPGMYIYEVTTTSGNVSRDTFMKK